MTPESPTIAPPQSDNQALREILGQVALFRSIAAQQYDAVTGNNDVTVGVSSPYERAADPTAIKTVITNIGDGAGSSLGQLRISEAGALVAILEYPDTWVSPLNGSGAILIEAVSVDTHAAIATYTKESEE